MLNTLCPIDIATRIRCIICKMIFSINSSMKNGVWTCLAKYYPVLQNSESSIVIRIQCGQRWSFGSSLKGKNCVYADSSWMKAGQMTLKIQNQISLWPARERETKYAFRFKNSVFAFRSVFQFICDDWWWCVGRCLCLNISLVTINDSSFDTIPKFRHFRSVVTEKFALSLGNR